MSARSQHADAHADKVSERVLVVGPSWVGDMVMAQSLLETLRSRDPHVQIDVLAPSWSEPLLARMPQVHMAVRMPLGHGQLGLAARYRLGRSLRDRLYDRAIVLPRSWKSALVPYAARIPVRTGFRGEMRYGLINDLRAFDGSVLTQTVQRFVALGLPRDATLPPPIPQPRLEVDQYSLMRLREEFELDPQRLAIGLLPGAEYGPAKQWPLEYWGALAVGLAEAGYQIWILGSEKERESSERIRAMSDGVAVNLCGRTRLADAVDLIAACRVAVSNDSGLMHIAAAVGCHVVAIYGSSTPEYTPPLTAQKDIHYLRLECSPCFKRECPLGHLNCLRQIEPQDVLRSVLQVTGML